MQFLFGSLVRILPAALFLCALGIPAGCGNDSGSGPGGAGEDKAASSSSRGGSSKETQAGSGLRPDVKVSTVIIRMKDKETGQALPGVRVQLLFSNPESPDRISIINRKTNLDGEVRMETPRVNRMTVRSEFDLENRLLEPDPSGETIATFFVRTTYEVSGKVTDPTGKAVEGATVFLAPLGGVQSFIDAGYPLPETTLELQEFRRRFGYDMKAEVQTDENGRFTYPIKYCQTLLAAACADGLLSPSWLFVPFRLEQLDYEQVDIPLLPAARLNLTLYNAKNEALGKQIIKLIETADSRSRRPNAKKIHGTYSAIRTSGLEGRLEIDVPAGLELAVEGRVLFRAPKAGDPLPDPLQDRPLDTITPAPGEILDLVVMPLKSLRLHGVIRDETGKPMPGATLSLPVNTIDSREMVEESGIKDNFSLLIPYNVHWGMSYQVSKTGYTSIWGNLMNHQMEDMAILLDVQLKRNVDFTVTADPVVDKVWLIRLQDPSLDAVTSYRGCERLESAVGLNRGKPKGSGEFIFHGIDPGPAAILAQKGSFGFVRIDGISVENSADHAQHLNIVPSTGTGAFADQEETVLKGRIAIPEGMQPQKIEVTLMRNDLVGVRRWDPLALGKKKFGWSKLRAGADGNFLFQGLMPGRYMVAAALHEWDTRINIYRELHIESGVNEVALDADEGEEKGTVAFRMLDNRASPIFGVELFLLDPVDSPLGRASGASHLTFSDEEGMIVLSSLPPGRYGFSLNRPRREGYIMDGRVLVEAGTRSEVEIILK